MFLILVKPSLAQLVEHGTVVKAAGIPGSPVQVRNGGLILFIFFTREICATVEFEQNRNGDRT